MVRLNVEAVVDLRGRDDPEPARRGRGAVLNAALHRRLPAAPGQATYAAEQGVRPLRSTACLPTQDLADTGATATTPNLGPAKTEFIYHRGNPHSRACRVSS